MDRVFHDLKILPKFAELRKLGIKGFEIRKNDRDFKVGHILRLHIYAPGFGYLPDGGEEQPAWAHETTEITWMTEYGMAEGYVCLATKTF